MLIEKAHDHEAPHDKLFSVQCIHIHEYIYIIVSYRSDQCTKIMIKVWCFMLVDGKNPTAFQVMLWSRNAKIPGVKITEEIAPLVIAADIITLSMVLIIVMRHSLMEMRVEMRVDVEAAEVVEAAEAVEVVAVAEVVADAVDVEVENCILELLI